MPRQERHGVTPAFALVGSHIALPLYASRTVHISPETALAPARLPCQQQHFSSGEADGHAREQTAYRGRRRITVGPQEGSMWKQEAGTATAGRRGSEAWTGGASKRGSRHEVKLVGCCAVRTMETGGGGGRGRGRGRGRGSEARQWEKRRGGREELRCDHWATDRAAGA
ncbi:hypothetical protein KC19_12G003100 [Ceratodon purpureus]|uniref:Uncharacterized protein n=1 Tax=Ceratodon purpureus TaxID=3225 RepID=A0A8T0G4F8_CERPU|nr:hypothetical protein KC19_12G003100 [Ceratodon purpureus]